MENIVLIGFSGTGKTTIGKLLAQRLGKSFVDIDVEIEQKCKSSVEEIFRLHGEQYFRKQEHAIVRSLPARSNTVIATGGGAILSPDNAAILKGCGVIIALQAAPEIILSRLEADSIARPLLNHTDRLQRIRHLMAERAEKYNLADYIVETSEFTPQGVVDTILEFLPLPEGTKSPQALENPLLVKKIYGLIGEKLSHSLSPQIHSFLFKQLNIAAAYFLFPLRREDLQPAFAGLKLLGAKGVNVTIPYKLDIMPLLDEVSTEARSIGAVNTITFGDRCVRGYNTDYQGFGLMLKQHGICPQGRYATILGTGGAAQTVACYLRDHGIRDIHMVSRRVGQPRTDKVPVQSYQELACSTALDILVNCTPVGMYPNLGESPLDKRLLGRFSAAVDLIYNPLETQLLADAKSMGLQTGNGLAMLVGQAVFAEEMWQSRRIDVKVLDPLLKSMNEFFVPGRPAQCSHERQKGD